MIKECDGKSKLHDPIILGDGDTAMDVLCKECKHRYTIRKDPFKGVPEARGYIKVFRREALQGNDNLFYKYFPQHLKQ